MGLGMHQDKETHKLGINGSTLSVKQTKKIISYTKLH